MAFTISRMGVSLCLSNGVAEVPEGGSITKYRPEGGSITKYRSDLNLTDSYHTLFSS